MMLSISNDTRFAIVRTIRKRKTNKWPSQKFRGDSGLIGERGRKSPDFLGGVSRSLLTVSVVDIVEFVSALSLSGSAFFFSRPFCSLAPGLGLLLLSDEEMLRPSCFSSSPELPPFFNLSAAVLGGGESKRAYSSSMYLASFLQPFQHSRQLQTRNLKQKASIFMHGWKQMHKLRKSILFFSEWARRRLRWQVIAKSR